MITHAIKKCLKLARKKGWTKTYWAFDIHGTILKPTFSKGVISTEFYPEAKETLRLLEKRKDIVKILYTCSYPEEIRRYLSYFKKARIKFDCVNCNPEIIDGAYGYYKHKFYFNVLLDDKAGFNAK